MDYRGRAQEKKVIYEYLVQCSNGPVWISKAEAIMLAEENRLRATVVHLKSGAAHLRPQQGCGAFAQIV